MERRHPGHYTFAHPTPSKSEDREMTSSVSTAPATRLGGLALMAGIVLAVVSSILHPGGLLVDPVDQTDFALAIGAMADNASLAHLVTMLTSIGMLLYIYGFSTLFRLSRQTGGAGIALKCGIAASMFGWAIFVIAMSMRHLTIHLMQRAESAEPAMKAGLEGLALNTYVAMAGVVLTLIVTYPFGSALSGIGLAGRFSSGSIYKLASHGLTVIGVAGLLVFLLVQHATGLESASLLLLNTGLLWIGSVCLFIIGWGMYQGRSELTSAD